MAPPTEIELILRAKKDPSAFGELYELHFERIYRYVFNQVRIRTDTQDIVAETFFKALRAIHSYTPSEKPFAAWLYSIARNCTMDHFRRSRREIVVDNPTWGGRDLPLEQVEEQELIDRALQQLTPEQQEVLRL
ncbi:MAG: sigma-70 family RNA polymerase sigma factor, partial [Syntrophomonadaceae bacterium]|nr:sigma-70 family RNA polymerase sigma factor [Syntrophomonadaceae bacterium]